MAKRKTPEQGADTLDVVVNDDFSYVSPTNGKTYKMTMKEQRFCDAYLEFSADGVQAVYEAGYKAKNALVASGIAYTNLKKPNLMAYIASKLEEYGFNDDTVSKQHLFVLNQMSDLRAKNQAIDMFYKLKGAYAPDKHINVNLNFKPDAKSAQLAAEFEAKLKAELAATPQ